MVVFSGYGAPRGGLQLIRRTFRQLASLGVIHSVEENGRHFSGILDEHRFLTLVKNKTIHSISQCSSDGGYMTRELIKRISCACGDYDKDPEIARAIKLLKSRGYTVSRQEPGKND